MIAGSIGLDLHFVLVLRRTGGAGIRDAPVVAKGLEVVGDLGELLGLHLVNELFRAPDRFGPWNACGEVEHQVAGKTGGEVHLEVILRVATTLT